MTRSSMKAIAATALLAVCPLLAFAQNAPSSPTTADTTATVAKATTKPKADMTVEDSLVLAAKAKKIALLYRPIELQHYRAADQRGINVFETPKYDTNVPFDGVKLLWGGAFTQQFQGLQHKNTAAPKMTAGVDANQLITIGHGFNNAVANLNLGVQLAQGIRINVTTYASARHHQETWIKDGYFLMDASPIDNDYLNLLMHFVTLRVGHFEVNYGDQHFRRSDNGNTIYNPFVGNLLMDAFTTEIGGEAYFRNESGVLAMAGITAGEVHGQVTAPEKRSPGFLGKLGFDRQIDSTRRVRLTGSIYRTAHSASNTLYSGDRGGSRYYDVLENTASTEVAQAWSGNVRPGMSDNITAVVFNPFVKIGGIEFFGNVEQATGKTAAELTNRTWKQYSGEAIYRFLPREQLYVGARYNTASGGLVGIANDVSVNRSQIAAGWFVTPALLAKIEWVNQKYNDFPVTDIRNGGAFRGFMVEGAVAF
ncbi:MAG: hypothetical protein ABIT20_16260 [Gemmatimonadaceae bacterium]